MFFCPRSKLVSCIYRVTPDCFEVFSYNNQLSPKMKSNSNRTIPKPQKPRHVNGDGLNWVIIAGGALLSTLSIRLGYKLKQALETKQPDDTSNAFKENGKFTARKRSGACPLHSTAYCFTQDEDECYHCLSGISQGTVEIKQPPTSPVSKDIALALPLVEVTATESRKENGMIWTSSPECLELPQKRFNHSNSSDSPCVSESGSDVSSKREVINRLRQQLKRRDEMILEMQGQITNLQNALNTQQMHSADLQAQIDSANRDLFDSEREIQRLRKAIADHCVVEMGTTEKPPKGRNWHVEPKNGQANGFHHSSRDLGAQHVGVDGMGEGERIEMLKREVEELKELIEGKDFLLQSYKEQKMELCSKIKELQLRLASQVPSIL